MDQNTCWPIVISFFYIVISITAWAWWRAWTKEVKEHQATRYERDHWHVNNSHWYARWRELKKNSENQIASMKIAMASIECDGDDDLFDVMEDLSDKLDQVLSAFRDDESAGEDWKPPGWKPEQEE